MTLRRGTSDKQTYGAGFQISIVRRKVVLRNYVLFTRMFCCQLLLSCLRTLGVMLESTWRLLSITCNLVACWLERRTRDRKVASSNPGWSGGRIFFSSQLCVPTLIRCPFHPRVTAMARKRPRSICQKCRWRVTPKHAYIFDPTKSEWAAYAAIQA